MDVQPVGDYEEVNLVAFNDKYDRASMESFGEVSASNSVEDKFWFEQ